MTDKTLASNDLPFFEAVVQRVREASELLFTESDRGCVLVAGAMLDEAVGALLRAFLMHDRDVTKELFDLPNAPLSTFAARLRLCRALGLFTNTIYRDLDRVRTIRNAGAHFDRKGVRPTGFSFEDKNICDNIREMTSIPCEFALMPPRLIFVGFVSLVGSILAEHAANASIVNRHAGQTRAAALLLGRTPVVPWGKYLRRMAELILSEADRPTPLIKMDRPLS